MYSLTRDDHASVVLTFLFHALVLLGLGMLGVGSSGSFSESESPDEPSYVRASVVALARPEPQPQAPPPPEPEPEPVETVEPEPVLETPPSAPAPPPELEPEPIVSQQPESRPQPLEALEQRRRDLLPQQELQQVQQRVQQILQQARPPTPPDLQPDDLLSAQIDTLLDQSSAQQRTLRAPSTEDALTADNSRDLALAYLARNKKLVERNFNVGGVAQKQLFAGLNVLIKIKLDSEGKLLGASIIQSSGNDLFDKKALNAVRRVGKFIVPSDPDLNARYFQEIVMDYSL